MRSIPQLARGATAHRAVVQQRTGQMMHCGGLPPKNGGYAPAMWRIPHYSLRACCCKMISLQDTSPMGDNARRSSDANTTIETSSTTRYGVAHVRSNANMRAAESVVTNEDETLRKDAVAYVQAFGGTLEEAVQHLKLQSIVATLDEQLQSKESSTFAGLWIEHTPKFRVVVQFTQDAQNTVSPYIQNGPLANVVEVQIAPVSLAQLKIVHNQLLRDIEATGIETASGTNLQKNRIELEVKDRKQFEAAIVKLGKRLPNNVEIIVVSAFATPAADWYAGLSLSGCTSGYTMKNASGTKYSSTAGHCPAGQVSPLTSPAAYIPPSGVGGAYDFQLNTPPSGSTLRNWAKDGSGYRSITGQVARGSVGTLVCKYGKTTIYTCGTIEKNNYTYYGSPAYLLIGSTSSTKIACGGDSGGPVYSGSNAYGIVTAAWCDLSNNKVVVMPMQSFIDYGFNPATS